MSEEFYKIIKDFVSDIVITFPEYKPIIDKWWRFNEFADIEDVEEREKAKKEKQKQAQKKAFSKFDFHKYNYDK